MGYCTPGPARTLTSAARKEANRGTSAASAGAGAHSAHPNAARPRAALRGRRAPAQERTVRSAAVSGRGPGAVPVNAEPL